MKNFSVKKQFLMVAFLFVITMMAYSQPAGWTRYQVFLVTNNTASVVTDYQLLLTVNTQALISQGYMDATGKDIRFSGTLSGAVFFNYWIDSGLNTSTTKIWVKIPTIPASGTTMLYWFYSNPAATPVSAVLGTFFGPNSATDSVVITTAGGVANSQRGFKFQPNQDLLVTSFGKREPTGTQRYITMFNFTTTGKVAQTQVSGPSGSYSYGLISRPIWLSKDTSYLCILYQGTGDGYYYGASSQIGQHLTYGDMRYCNTCDQNVFPTSILTNYHYGCPDFLYWTKNNVTPAPTYQNITSINNFAYNTATNIYPNPTSGLVNLLITEKVQVYVYDALGNLILQKEVKDSNQGVDLSSYKNGIYLMKLVSGTKQDIVKITKIN